MVSEITDNEELNNNIRSGKWLVCYYATWCGHCQNMADAWEQLENKTRENRLNITLVKIEQKNITDLAITGYPTIKYVENGIPEDYTGERTTDAMYAFIKKHTICTTCGKMRK